MTSAEEFKVQGNEAFKKGEYDKAIGLYQKAIELDPQNHVLYSNKSGALINVGKFQEALDDSEQCLKLSPQFSKGYQRKGTALENLGKTEEALEVYKLGLQVDPNNQELKGSVQRLSSQGQNDFMKLL